MSASPYGLIPDERWCGTCGALAWSGGTHQSWCWTGDPSKPSLSGGPSHTTERQHGEPRMYKAGCRCGDCLEAYVQRDRQYRERKALAVAALVADLAGGSSFSVLPEKHQPEIESKGE